MKKKFIALGLLVGVVAAFKFLPWYVSVGLIVGVVLLGKFLLGKLFTGAIMGLFEAKSAVLRGATVRLHAISDAPEPKRDEDWDDEDIEPEPLHYRYVDLTIAPANSAGPGRRITEDEAESFEEEAAADAPDDGCPVFTMWDPSELEIVSSDAKAGLDMDDEDTLGEVHDVSLYENGQWVPLEGEKLMGSHRLRLHVGVTPGVDEFKIKYYFEILKNAGSDAQPRLSPQLR